MYFAYYLKYKYNTDIIRKLVYKIQNVFWGQSTDYGRTS